MIIAKTLALLLPALAISTLVHAQTPQVRPVDKSTVQKTSAEKTMTEGAVVAPVEKQIPDSLAPTVITFTHTEHDFGKIKQGDRVRHKFVFTNTGNNPAKLENVKAGCGCTIPTWPKDQLIAVGETREIEVEFNSAGKAGLQSKTVSVTYNGEPRVIVLTFKANIEVPPPVVTDPNGTPAPAPAPTGGSH